LKIRKGKEMKTDKFNDFVKDVKLSAGRIARHSSVTESKAKTGYSMNIEITEPITKYYIGCGVKECEFQKFGFCLCTTGHCYSEENNQDYKNMDSRKILYMEKEKELIE
jgi:hypothetical protein